MNTLTRRSLLALTAAGLLAGCAATGNEWQPATNMQPGHGMVYVYRPLGDFLGRGEAPYVQIGTGLPRQLRAGGYVAFEVPQGIHTVRAFQNMLFVPTIPFFIEVEVSEGRSSYIRLDQRISKLGGGNGGVRAMQKVEIEEVPPDVGAAEIAETRAN